MFRPRGFARRFRVAVVVVCLLSLVGATAGFPVWLPGKAAKDLSRPFPCQNRPCGCGSAAECWADCCCFTNTEKLVWAQANGVTPPDFVVAAAAEEQPPVRSCCSKKPVPTKSCCAKKSNCCTPEHASTCPTPKRARQAAEGGRFTLVLSSAARACQGLVQLWLVIGAAVPVQPVVWRFDWDIVEPVFLIGDIATSIEFSPPTRPPCCC